MTYSLEFELLGLPKLPNELLTRHWSKVVADSKRWKNDVFLITAGKRPSSPLLKAKLTLVRRSTKEPDRDNLYGSFKPVIDGLITAKIIEDDNPQVISKMSVRWEKIGQKKGSIYVKVEKLKQGIDLV